jgi:hypothetical protein
MDEEERILELTLLMIRRRCIDIEQNKHEETLSGYMRLFELVNSIENNILRLIKIEEEKEKLNKE